MLLDCFKELPTEKVVMAMLQGHVPSPPQLQGVLLAAVPRNKCRMHVAKISFYLNTIELELRGG